MTTDQQTGSDQDTTQVHRLPSGGAAPEPDAGTSADAAHEGGHQADDGYGAARRRDRFRGVNWGAAVFGWMVSVFVGALLAVAVGAVVTGLGLTGEVTGDATAEATTPGLVAAAVLFAALVAAYYAGGYVAGRMSRFDGGRQGVAVWVISLILTGAAVGAGLFLGGEYVDRSTLRTPDLPLPADLAAVQSVVAGVAALLSSLLAAVAGGKVGCRYHRKVDAVFS